MLLRLPSALVGTAGVAAVARPRCRAVRAFGADVAAELLLLRLVSIGAAVQRHLAPSGWQLLLLPQALGAAAAAPSMMMLCYSRGRKCSCCCFWALGAAAAVAALGIDAALLRPLPGSHVALLLVVLRTLGLLQFGPHCGTRCRCCAAALRRCAAALQCATPCNRIDLAPIHIENEHRCM